MGSSLVPRRPQFVFMALVAELKERSVQDAVEVAQNLLPGIDVS